MTLKLFNVWVIYQINTLEHSMLSFFLILESLNKIWASFDIFALQCYNKRQGRKLRPVWQQNTLQKRVKFVHKSCIYSQHFSLNSQFMPCSFSLCSLMKYTFSFQRASWAKSWNMTTKIAEMMHARTSPSSSPVLLVLGCRWRVALVAPKNSNVFIGWQKIDAQQKWKLQSSTTHSILLPAWMAAGALRKKSKTNGDHSWSIQRNRKSFRITKVVHHLQLWHSRP